MARSREWHACAWACLPGVFGHGDVPRHFVDGGQSYGREQTAAGQLAELRENQERRQEVGEMRSAWAAVRVSYTWIAWLPCCSNRCDLGDMVRKPCPRDLFESCFLETDHIPDGARCSVHPGGSGGGGAYVDLSILGIKIPRESWSKAVWRRSRESDMFDVVEMPFSCKDVDWSKLCPRRCGRTRCFTVCLD
jgi:hypothetical protein